MTKTIYTAFCNNYDSLKEPRVITNGWKYICYTNDSSIKSDVWDVIVDPEMNTVKDVRKKKIIPPFDSDISIWVDASMIINCDLNEFVFNNMKSDFCLMKHPNRNCVYEEAMACIKYKKDSTKRITDQILKYNRDGYPKNNGMVGTGIILRKHNNYVFDFCYHWNNDVQSMSCRDQLSFNYNQWRYGLKYSTFDFGVTRKEFLLQPHNHRMK